MALGTIGQGALKQLSVSLTKPGKGRELGSVPNRWNRVGSAGKRGRKTWPRAEFFICAKVARDAPTIVIIAPVPRLENLSSFCPQTLSVPGCLPVIPVPAPASWLHPHPDRTSPAPRIVSHPPALPPLQDEHFTPTGHLRGRGRSHGSIRLIFQSSELEKGGLT